MELIKKISGDSDIIDNKISIITPHCSIKILMSKDLDKIKYDGIVSIFEGSNNWKWGERSNDPLLSFLSKLNSYIMFKWAQKEITDDEFGKVLMTIHNILEKVNR